MGLMSLRLSSVTQWCRIWLDSLTRGYVCWRPLTRTITFPRRGTRKFSSHLIQGQRRIRKSPSRSGCFWPHCMAKNRVAVFFSSALQSRVPYQAFRPSSAPSMETSTSAICRLELLRCLPTYIRTLPGQCFLRWRWHQKQIHVSQHVCTYLL